MPTQDRLRFDALLKEAELVRNESLLCIDKIRRLAIIAVGISGASLPIIASLLTDNISDDTSNNAVSLAQRLEQNAIIIQFLCFGISGVCAAILQIYVGIFKQIFSFAKYQRQVISPNLNQLVGNNGPKIFQWEIWLQSERQMKTRVVGDLDLMVEPYLIAFCALIFVGAAETIGLYFQFFVYGTSIFAILTVLHLFWKHKELRRVLRESKAS